jgi:hypothetical protein
MDTSVSGATPAQSFNTDLENLILLLWLLILGTWTPLLALRI